MLAGCPRAVVQGLTMSYTYTRSDTFTETHAKHLAAKVVADLYQCSIFYDRPAASAMADYRDELVILLRDGYVQAYEFGFKQNGRRIVCWRYEVGPDGGLHADDAAGGLIPGANVRNADYYNFLTFSSEWFALSPSAREAIESRLPFRRLPGSLPADGNGYWVDERGYSAGGVRIQRRVFRPWS